MEVRGNIFTIATSLEHISSPFKIPKNNRSVYPHHQETWKKVLGVALFIFASLTLVWGTILFVSAAWKQRKIRLCVKKQKKPAKVFDSIINLEMKPKSSNKSLSPHLLKTVIKDLDHHGIIGIENQVKQFTQAIAKGSRGFLFYGPSGTGKTTLAKHIGEIIGCPKERISFISAGNYLHKSLEGLNLSVSKGLKPAREAYEKYGKKSPLYVLIIDDIDAIFSKWKLHSKKLNSAFISVILPLIDSNQRPKNLVIIGTTSRKQDVDPVLLKPGYLNVLIEFSPPAKLARLKILEYYAKQLIEKGLLGKDVDLNVLVNKTDHYSGRDIKFLFHRANFMALERLSEDDTLEEKSKAYTPEADVVTMGDFQLALKEFELPIKKKHPSKANPSQVSTKM